MNPLKLHAEFKTYAYAFMKKEVQNFHCISQEVFELKMG